MKKLLLFAGIIVLSIQVSAQKETWNWTFGNGAGLSWRPENLRSFAATGLWGTPDATLDNLPGSFKSEISTVEGCFTISDKNGNLMFYSDGTSIWKADGTEIYSTLGGNSSSAQSGIIVPYPGDVTRYICVGLGQSSSNNMGYIIVKANSPDDVTIEGSRVSFEGYTKILGESMTAVKHANGVDWWIVAPGRATAATTLNSWLATSAGVQATAPVITSIDLPSSAGSNGYFKFTPDGKHFVWGQWTGNRIMYGDFDNNTGEFSNVRIITDHGAYGVEFSPNGKYLYTSTNQNSGATFHKIAIWDLDALLAGTTTTWLKILGTSAPYAMQNDSFGRMWFVCRPSNSARNIIYVIDNPDDPENLRGYSMLGFFSQGGAQAGLPSLPASYFYRPMTGPNRFCMSNMQSFSFKVSKGAGANELLHTEWNFGDGRTGSVITDDDFSTGEQIHSYTYKKPGKYTITVKCFLLSDGSEVETLRQTFDLTVKPCVLPVNPNIHLYQ